MSLLRAGFELKEVRLLADMTERSEKQASANGPGRNSLQDAPES